MKTVLNIALMAFVALQLNGCASPDVNESDKLKETTSDTATSPSEEKTDDNTGASGENPFPDLKVTISRRSFTHAQINDFFSCIATKATNVAFKKPAEKYLNELKELTSESDEAQFKSKLFKIATNIEATEKFSGTDCKADNS